MHPPPGPGDAVLSLPTDPCIALPYPLLQITTEVSAEASKCGPVLGVAVPIPPTSVDGAAGCRIYIKFATADEANRCKSMMDGRTFDESVVKAFTCTDTDFMRAQAGEWFAPTAAAPAAPGLPGLGMLGAARPSLPGAPALPGLAGLSLPPGFSLGGQ